MRSGRGLRVLSVALTLLAAGTAAAAQSADDQPQVQVGVDFGAGPVARGGPTPMVSPHLVVNPAPQLRVELYLDVVKTQRYSDQSDRYRFLAFQVSPVVERGARSLFFFTTGIGVLWNVNEFMNSTVSHKTFVVTHYNWGVGIPLGVGVQVVLAKRLALTGQAEIIFILVEGGTYRSAIGISIPLGQSFRKP
jgi:hypothetical protein